MINKSIRYLLLCVIAILSSANLQVRGQIIINEVMASNWNFIADDDGSFEDWIELLNAGDQIINLQGYSLSDNPEMPAKWVFPEIYLRPGEVLMVWASGKDRKPQHGQMVNGIRRLFYSNITGTSVNNLTNHPSFPDSPTEVTTLTGFFEAPVNIADNYGQHLFTWLRAPQTGNFQFWLAGDDNSQLFLSTDSLPENAKLIASVPEWTNSREWFKYPQQASASVFLEAGKVYYMSALMKEGEGGDNLAVRWQLPDGIIEAPMSAAHCYFPSTGLHTNFSISSGQEQVFLIDPQQNLIDEMPLTFIPTNISFGRKPGNTADWFFFGRSTPGKVNSTAGYKEITPAPAMLPEGGIFSQSFQVQISSTDPDAVIWYTTNGTLPMPNSSTRYTQPVNVSGVSYIRAIAVSPGKLPSEINGNTYAVAHANMDGFSSNLPVMILHEFNNPITSGDKTPAFLTLYNAQESGRTAFKGQPAVQTRVIADLRGSSSQMFPKKGYGFHMQFEDGRNRKESLLEMPADHNWVLHGPYSDKTLMRNAMSYAIGTDAGHYSPRTRFVELFLHSGTGALQYAHYHGVYVLTERIKISEGRLNVDELELHHNEYPEVSGGYIFSYDRLNPGDVGFTTKRGNLFTHVRPNEQTITSHQRNYLIALLDSVETALFGSDFLNLNNGYRAFVDTESFIDMHLITELCKEIDGFRFSSFYYKDRQGKVKAGPLWDFNLSLGNANYNQGWQPQGWYYSLLNPKEYMYGWYIRMFQDPKFAAAYNRRYRHLRLTAFSDVRLMERINQYRNTLQESQARNFQRWKTLGTWVWPNWYVGNTWQQEVDWMTNWLKQRLVWMDSQLGLPYTMIHYWNFNQNNYLQPSYSIHGASVQFVGANESELVPGEGQGFTGYNSRNGDDPLTHLRVNNPAGAELKFNLSTINYRNILFSYETRRSVNGANTHFISYTIDGNTFIPVDTIRVTDIPDVYVIDFAGVPGVDNNSLFGIRIRMVQDETLSGGGLAGNNRIENVTLDGEAMPGVVRPPVQTAILPARIELVAGQSSHTISVNKYFAHPDGKALKLSFRYSLPQVATAGMSAGNMVVAPLKQGGIWLEYDVSDGINPPLKNKLYVLVHPQVVPLKNTSFTFDTWSPNEPEGSFPANMMFLQSDIDDPGLSTSLSFAYLIPADDYAAGDIANIGFPYRNQSRTRINGLGNNGISFINTGRGRDVGAAVAAIDTREVQKVSINWKATTERLNSRVYAIRLQYRRGISEPWKDLLHNGNIQEYKRGAVAGHSTIFENVLLPADALNNAYVQLRWVYYFTGEGTGARDMLSLNHIFIERTDNVSTGNINSSLEFLQVFPNPVENHEMRFNRIVTGNLFDLHGRHILSVAGGGSISVSGIKPGIYIFRTESGQTIKVMIPSAQ